MDSLPTASNPHAADDAEVGSQEGTHQEEEAPEVSQDNLPDFAPDSAPGTHSGSGVRRATPSQEGQDRDAGCLRPTRGAG